ncbi:related to Cuticle-degrading protease [Ramularia collo-cygni]|uniref:Related to Cuticle-degrading protease n=1 Tax=Ramularia collo-cygni TaxID=112498 RepID=A0A2D3V2P5_9PEZI|nr:related to Cuticle-degrading protease [Ramularia collo-cygni]CZT17806.1 related to Cuticle-degrading protease [Ramularia collo-cygni]
MRATLNFILALPLVLALPTIDRRQDAGVQRIADSWIVELEDDADLAATLKKVSEETGVEAKSKYTIGGFQGFAFDGDDSVVDALAEMGALKRIEADVVVEAYAPVVDKRALVTQSPSTWGTARISSRTPGGSSYVYDNTAGAGTRIYVIDTGINSAHQDFGGRAIQGANFVTGESITDGNGHGTHCSGTAAGTTYGVAKRATVVGVKVLGNAGSGSLSGILNGINWALSNARSTVGISRAVLSLSLGSPFSQSSNNAVAQAVAAGAFVTVAAGNNNANAANYSPASEPSACTVGATDINDNRSSFSNYGSLVDIFAPGTSIQSTWIGSTTAVNTISGTSMATPHIAGLAAYLIGLEGTRSPAALCQRIKDLAVKNVIANVGSGSPNALAYNGNGR